MVHFIWADSILFPEVPIALRLSSHLLLGVVRIYSRKVNYLFDDCSEALLKIKQAFRSTAVDLPPEESTAPYHSITLPETFDLDDFELPDNENFQGLVPEYSGFVYNWSCSMLHIMFYTLMKNYPRWAWIYNVSWGILELVLFIVSIWRSKCLWRMIISCCSRSVIYWISWLTKKNVKVPISDIFSIRTL